MSMFAPGPERTPQPPEQPPELPRFPMPNGIPFPVGLPVGVSMAISTAEDGTRVHIITVEQPNATVQFMVKDEMLLILGKQFVQAASGIVLP